MVVCFTLPARAQQTIGSATAVKPDARGSVAGQLSANSGVHANETVTTGGGGQANLQFLDNTKLSVGPTSSVRLDKFVYDPNKRKGSVVVNATSAAHRFATGVQDSKSYEIKTPVCDTWGARDSLGDRGDSGWSYKATALGQCISHLLCMPKT